MNANEYGNIFAFNTSFDMSSQTSLQVQFWNPDLDPCEDAATVTRTATLGVAPLVTDLGTFAANEYVKVIMQNGDITEEGTWSARVIYVDASGQHLISNVGQFVVGC